MENRVSEIYGRSTAFQVEMPPELPWLIPIKINNASIYKAQISPQNPLPPLCQITSRAQQRLTREEGKSSERVCGKWERENSVCASVILHSGSL